MGGDYYLKTNNPDDVITPDWCAKDIVEWYNPSGAILDPCAGDGVFLKYLPPETAFCEIKIGIDFFSWDSQVDWIVGNPPYSIFREWLQHSFDVAQNIVYLTPSYKLFNPLSGFRIMRENGTPKHIRVYDVGRKIEWARGRPILATHFVRGYFGTTTWSFCDDQ